MEAAPLEITRFGPHTIFDGDDIVCMLITFDATALDKSYAFPNNAHLWRFNAARKAVTFDYVSDTAAIRRLYDLINAGDIGGFGHQLAGDFASAKTCRASRRPRPASSSTLGCYPRRSRTCVWFCKT